MQRDVATIGPDDTLAEAARSLRNQKTSGLVVTQAGVPVGILTERDFVHAVVDGRDPATTPVKTCMSPDVISVGPGADETEATSLMARHGIRHLPVIEGGRLVGMFSALDPFLARNQVRSAETFANAGILSHFQGPYSGGPPPEALETDAPRLDKFGLAELRRMMVILFVVLFAVGRAMAARLLRRRSRSWPEAASRGLVDGFEILGPTFVKLGQLIASSPGIFPAPLADACLRCLDEVPPFDAATVREMITADLGRSPQQLFRSFEETPLSAASIAQVHACVLPDGREAVIKLQRPGIHHRMNTDLRIQYFIATRLLNRLAIGRRANVVGVVEDLHRVTNQELNAALEAHRQTRFRQKIGAFGDNRWITAPEVYWDYCGPHLICMERMTGVPMDQFETLRQQGVDGELVLRRGVKVWMEALMAHGPFHGDVHAGNLWVLDDGRATYLDFGIMGELVDEWKQLMRDLFYTAMIDQDYARVVRAYKRVGVLPEDIGSDQEVGMRIAMVMEPMLDQKLGNVSLGDTMKANLELAQEYGASVPRELLLIVKQLLYFERYAKALAPDYVMARDVFLIQNIFPDAVAKKAADLGIELPAD
jgi:predicted unusual protein kinase regulating ubiquinone biosynthesis (AarF/ABC1/UbiB family)/predicted transcriptional regulator